MADFTASVASEQRVASEQPSVASEQPPVVSGQQPNASKKPRVASEPQPDVSEQSPVTSELPPVDFIPTHLDEFRMMVNTIDRIVAGLFKNLSLAQLVQIYRLCEFLTCLKSSNVQVSFGVKHDHDSLQKCGDCDAKFTQSLKAKTQSANAKGVPSKSKEDGDFRKETIVIDNTTIKIIAPEVVNVKKLLNSAFNVTIGAPTCCIKTCKNFEIRFNELDTKFARVFEEDMKMSKRSNRMISTEILSVEKTEDPTNNKWWIHKIIAVTTVDGFKYKRKGVIRTPKSLDTLSPAHFKDMFELCFNSSSVSNTETIRAQFQTDTHGTKGPGEGGIYIGLTLTLNDKEYAIYLVGKDIGCGISAFPLLVKVGGKYQPMSERQLAMLKKDLIIVAQIFNRRGVGVEKGSSTFTKEQFEEYTEYLRCGFEHCGKDLRKALLEAYEILCIADKIDNNCRSDDEKIAAALRYILPRLLSIGSTGNHYIEVNGGIFVTVHAGSRSLGSELDEWMSKYFGKIGGCKTVAIEKEHAEMAGRIYGLLNDIASANRAAVFYMLVSKLNKIMEKDDTQRYGFAESVEDVLQAFQQMPFIQTYHKHTGCSLEQAVDKMRVGNIHNGITVYNEIGTDRCVVVITKGSVVTDSIAIVADKASKGCIVVVCLLDSKKFKPITFGEFTKIENPIFCSLEEFGLTSLPHGSGRNRSGNETAKSTPPSLIHDILTSGMSMSFGSGTSFDNPNSIDGAYRESGIDSYASPNLHIAHYGTDVNFKENVCQEPKLVEQFKQMVWYMWNNVFNKTIPNGDDLFENFLICTDLVLIKHLLGKDMNPLPFVQILCNLKYTAEYNQTNRMFANMSLRNKNAPHYDKSLPISGLSLAGDL